MNLQLFMAHSLKQELVGDDFRHLWSHDESQVGRMDRDFLFRHRLRQLQSL